MTNRHVLPQQLTPLSSVVQPSPPLRGWDWELIRRVGKGTSSHVFEGIDLRDGSRVAVKVARTEADNRLLADEAQTLLLVDSLRIPAVRALGRVQLDTLHKRLEQKIVIKKKPQICDY